MAKALISVDVNKAPAEQPVPLHNRWHPDIPPVVAVNPGDIFKVECIDWTGGQIHNTDNANDVRDVDLTQVHYLSGPIAVNGAEPGDLLVVDVLDIQPLSAMEWGFTGIFAKTNGGGFLTDYFPEARKVIWDFKGIYTSTRHIQGVKFAGITHSGLIGVAPSADLLGRWNKREGDLIATNPNRVPSLANPPTAHSALLGQVKPGSPEWSRIAGEGARTVPPRENGGNCDIKNLVRGSRIYFPVFVKGGNLSIGDTHFSQGDGEITFCGGIETAGAYTLHVDLIKDGVNRYGGVANPIFKPGNVAPQYSEYLVFEGVSVDDQDKQYYLDPFIAYQRACLNAVHYLQKFGFSGEQVYFLIGTAPIEGRISGIVDVPNSCCTLYIPTEIFEFDVTPSGAGPSARSLGAVAKTS